MDIGKALAISALSGILAGALGGCGASTPAAATDPAAAGGAKASCSGPDHGDKGHCSAASATPSATAAPK